MLPKDRSNIGNARVAGMQESLHMTDQQYFICLMMFCEYLRLCKKLHVLLILY